MRFANPELRERYSLLVEGQCPHGHGPLVRWYGWGLCESCGVRWRVRGTVVESMVAEVHDFSVDSQVGHRLDDVTAELGFTPEEIDAAPD